MTKWEMGKNLNGDFRRENAKEKVLNLSLSQKT